MRYETYETRARFSYRPVLITLTSHLVVIDFRQGRISTAENSLSAFRRAGVQREIRNDRSRGSPGFACSPNTVRSSTLKHAQEGTGSVPTRRHSYDRALRMFGEGRAGQDDPAASVGHNAEPRTR